MAASSSKCVKPTGSQPTAFESRLATELSNIEASNGAIRNELKGLKFVAARRTQVAGGKRAIIMFVPFPQLNDYRKIHKTLVEEVEKKFSDHHVVIVGQRTILPKAWTRNRKASGPRPHSRTLKAVQEAILDDIVHPSEAVGKRTRFRVDGSSRMTVYLSPKDQAHLEGKLDTFSTVYKLLTNKDVTFTFPNRE